MGGIVLGAVCLLIPDSMSKDRIRSGRPVSAGKSQNRLAQEKSPYLLQHADNPVDWYPWGEEAFAKARKEDKPILLSIGYSTCHWCHVMEHESFENSEIAAVMNKYIVSIKVDREERPDVDKIYMTAVQTMTGSGGWPLNVFLTPDLKPFFGGTYFPPDPRWGRPGWPQIVERVGESWADPEQRKKLIESGENLTKGLERFLVAVPESAPAASAAVFHGAWESFLQSYDAEQGGFGSAPKFPMPVNQNFLLRYYAFFKKGEAPKSRRALDMVLHTLRSLANGGIYDHIGGGFSRYSTDERWHIPHFEKMLYDNAQLAVNFLEAYQITRDEFFGRVARETLEYVRRDMTHPDGGFYSAEDADSVPFLGAEDRAGGGETLSAEPQGQAADKRPNHPVEGAFYVWEKEEIENVLTAEEAGAFIFRYGVEKGGNAREDPHGEFQNKNILYVAQTLEDVAQHLGMPAAETERLLASARKKLFEARARRFRPHLDDKILTAWNGLMVTGFARAHQILEDRSYLSAAVKTARFVRSHLYDEKERTLYRRWRDGERDVPGLADDYAFWVQGLIDLYESSFDPEWLQWAVELTEEQNRRFYDAANGGFFMTAPGHDKNLLMRVRDEQDNVEPSASSVAAMNLLRLAQFTGREDFRAAAEKTLRAFGRTMVDQPRALPQMLAAQIFSLSKPTQIILAGSLDEADTGRLLKTVHARFLPHKIIVLADGGEGQSALSKQLPFLKMIVRKGGQATAYLCENYACRLPTNDPNVLGEQLNAF